MHADVHTPTRAYRKWLKRQARAPGVIESCQHLVLLANLQETDHIWELQGDRSWRFQPNQLGRRCDALRQIRRVHGVVIRMANPPMHQLPLGQSFQRTISVVRQQQLIACFQKGHVHLGQSCESAGQQDAMFCTFQLAQTLFQGKAGGRAVQAVGIAGLVQPLACAHVLDVVKKNRRGFVNRWLGRRKVARRLVGVVDQIGDWLHAIRPATSPTGWPDAWCHKPQKAGESKGWWAGIPPRNQG